MESVSPGRRVASRDEDGQPGRARLNQAVRESLRDLAVQLQLLSHRVSDRLELKGNDLESLDLITREGPIGPGALARRMGLHPATMTGMVDRLERGGWITRERDPDDRRAVTLHAIPARGPEVLRLYGGMNAAVAEICAGYSDAELALMAGFLRRIADAGRGAATEFDGP